MTAEIELFKKLIREAVSEGLREVVKELGQDGTDGGVFPLYTTKQVARIFGVSPFTVRSWARQGELRNHYQVLSGSACRLVFTNRDLVDFFSRNFPSPEDIGDHPCSPRSPKVRLLQKMLRMERLYLRRRRRAVEKEELDGDER